MKQKDAFGLVCRLFQERPVWIILVVISGFVARVLWWAYAEPIPVSDFEGYRHLAEGFLERGQLGFPNPSAYRLPGYPIFLAVFMKIISNSTAWLSFANLMLSTLLIYLVYRLSLYLTSEKTLAIIAACFCAFNPTFVFFSPILASEHLYVVLLLSAFLVFGDIRVNLSGHRVCKLILSAILLGTAVLTRGEGLFVLPIFLAISYLTFAKKTSHRYLAIIVYLLVFVATVAPWYLRNHYLVAPGSGLSTTGGINFYYAHNKNHYGWHAFKGTVFDGKDDVQQQKLGYQLGFEYLSKASLSRIVRDIARGTKRLFLSSSAYSLEWSISLPTIKNRGPFPLKHLEGIYWFRKLTLAYFALFLAAVLSCLFLYRYSFRTWLVFYGIVLMNWIGLTWIFWAKARYRYLCEVIFCILAALFIFEVIKRIFR